MSDAEHLFMCLLVQADSLPSEPPGKPAGVINAISELLEISKLVMSF